MNQSKEPFTQEIRRALLSDPQLVRLLGGAHVFDHADEDAAVPHITIGYSDMRECHAANERDGAHVVTLQIWPHTGEKAQAQKFFDAAHHALENAGLFDNDNSVRLDPAFAGSRRESESQEYQGVLRYHAVLRGKAA